MDILELPSTPQLEEAPRTFDFAGLSNVLFESADLLEESRESEDRQFRDAAIELAVRSLYTASTAIDRYVKAQQAAAPAPPPGALLAGPWAAAPATRRGRLPQRCAGWPRRRRPTRSARTPAA